MSEPLLQVKDLNQHFHVSRNFTVKAVNGVSFDIYPGETYGLVGESGSGKTTIGRSIIRLYNPTSGSIVFEGKEIAGKLDRPTEKMLREDMQMIFQDPMSSLNPRKKVGDIIGEGLDIHHRFAMNPKLIIADECISALDVSIQAQVVNLMKDIQDSTGCAYLFIAHDLYMVKYISDRIGVLHLGHMVETGTTDEIVANPVHPYTKSLLSAVPLPNPEVEKRRRSVAYDRVKEGVDYSAGTVHQVEGTHTVLATDEEFARWTA